MGKVGDGDSLSYEDIAELLMAQGYNELEVLEMLNNGGYEPGSSLGLEDYLAVMEAAESLDHVGAALRHAFRDSGIWGDEGYATPEEVLVIADHLDSCPFIEF